MPLCAVVVTLPHEIANIFRCTFFHLKTAQIRLEPGLKALIAKPTNSGGQALQTGPD